jgi:hypothetical protein
MNDVKTITGEKKIVNEKSPQNLVLRHTTKTEHSNKIMMQSNSLPEELANSTDIKDLERIRLRNIGIDLDDIRTRESIIQNYRKNYSPYVTRSVSPCTDPSNSLHVAHRRLSSNLRHQRNINGIFTENLTYDVQRQNLPDITIVNDEEHVSSISRSQAEHKEGNANNNNNSNSCHTINKRWWAFCTSVFIMIAVLLFCMVKILIAESHECIGENITPYFVIIAIIIGYHGRSFLENR